MSTHQVTRRKYSTLRAWREALGISQAEAGLLLQISESQYARLERGERGTTGKRAKVIMAKTGVPLDALVGVL